jgi:hypothetical protein
VTAGIKFDPDAAPPPVAPPVDKAALDRARALQDSIEAEFKRWGRKAPVRDRILLSSFLPSIESGDPEQVEAVSICLLAQVKDERVSRPALRYLTARCLRVCLARGFAPPPALTEIAVFLLEQPAPKHLLALPEERQRAIAFIVEFHGSEGKIASQRAIAKVAKVSPSAVRKWLADVHFVDAVNEAARKTILRLKT